MRSEIGSVLLRKSWTVPLLAAAHRPKTFSEIKRDLVPITDRALSHSLRDLHRENWIERSVSIEQRPPRPFYRVVNEGAEISQAIGLSL